MRTALLASLALTGLAIAGAVGSAPAAPLAAPLSAPSTAAVGHCHQPGPYQLPHGDDVVRLRPRDFTAHITHPYWPMRPGTVWHYVERGGGEVQRVTVRVTRHTKLIEGIRARVVRDTVRSAGEIVEDTRDWYAQDSGGSLWYLGEATAEYEDGELVSREGSWRYGRDGAQAGVILPARPRAGCSYREEHLEGEAEDRALVLSRRESVATPTGFHRRVLHTANSTPLEPRVLENKLYARGIGPIVEIDLSPTWSRAVLKRVTHR
ncbi:exported hypothetical protein [metagenome]|uniref:Uncharacterized protein n=1 Tax=metagenome TaxID=256318 RepID=A0A2P2BZ07_9ZZZZ